MPRLPPVPYALSLAAKTGDTIRGKKLTGFKQPSLGANAPAIDDAGRVAFYATFSEGAFVGEGIFTPRSLVFKNGDDVNGQTLEGIGYVPALNNRGTVVVRSLLSSGRLAILNSTSLVVSTGDTIGGRTLTDVGLPAINNRGTIAFEGSFSGGSGIFTPTSILAQSGEEIAGQTPVRFGPPSINDRGMVVFQGWLSGKIATGIFTPTTVLAKAGDTIGGKKLTDLFFGPTLTSNGTVAFIGMFAGGTGIFTQNALLVQSGDTIDAQTMRSFGYPMISDSGTVVFFATFAGGEGIFTQTSLITKTGDTISERTLTGLGQPVINCSGAVAFPAFFSDGSSAIVVARPKASTAESQDFPTVASLVGDISRLRVATAPIEPDSR
jgi:hypothetical protein